MRVTSYTLAIRDRQRARSLACCALCQGYGSLDLGQSDCLPCDGCGWIAPETSQLVPCEDCQAHGITLSGDGITISGGECLTCMGDGWIFRNGISDLKENDEDPAG